MHTEASVNGYTCLTIHSTDHANTYWVLWDCLENKAVLRDKLARECVAVAYSLNGRLGVSRCVDWC